MFESRLTSLDAVLFTFVCSMLIVNCVATLHLLLKLSG